ncbi:MAG: hypothetical protein JKY34_00650 [Kordiimonadaceae bacterium]|nr:hypothetical protein [Kordiimonadaceae bacterium]
MQVDFDLIIMLNNKEKFELSVYGSFAPFFCSLALGAPLIAGASANSTSDYPNGYQRVRGGINVN